MLFTQSGIDRNRVHIRRRNQARWLLVLAATGAAAGVSAPAAAAALHQGERSEAVAS